MLGLSGPPSSPLNLQFSPALTTDGSVVVRLEWGQPDNDGGANITGYQIFVDNLLAGNSSKTVVDIELNNSTGEYLVEIRAMNCAGYGPNVSRVYGRTGMPWL